MAITIPDWFIKQFEAEVSVAYQRTLSILGPCVRSGTVIGSTVNVPRYGKGKAASKDRHGFVPVMNVDHTTVEFPINDWYAGEWIDKLDLLKMNRDEMNNAANAAAYGLARKKDSLIVEALRDTLPGGQKVTDAGGLTKAKLMKGIEKLDEADVPDTDRFAIVGPHQWSELSLMPEFAREDWVDDKRMTRTRYQRATWNGITFINTQSLLTEYKNGDMRPVLLFHRSAIAWGEGSDINAEISYENPRASYFVNCNMSGGSKRIEDTGVVEISADDTSTIQ